MGERITRAELARRLGVSRQRVHQLVQAGKITLEGDGKVDFEKAQIEYGANTDIVRRSSAGRVASEVAQTVGLESAAPAGDLFNYNREKARREKFNADIYEARALEKIGDLVRREQVESDEFEIARMMRDRIIGWPAKLANFVPPEAMQLIEAEAKSLLQDMQDEIEKRFADGRQ